MSFRPEEPVEKVQYPCRTVGASVIFGDAVQFGECGQLVGELVFDEILPVVREGEEVVDVLFEILRIAVEEGVALLGGSCFVVGPDVGEVLIGVLELRYGHLFQSVVEHFDRFLLFAASGELGAQPCEGYPDVGCVEVVVDEGVHVDARVGDVAVPIDLHQVMVKVVFIGTSR